MKRTVYLNGKIFTSQLNTAFVNAIVVEEDKILWAGDIDACPFLEGSSVVDLEGRVVIPGICDAHMHPIMLSEYARQIACLPPKVNSIEELVSEISKVADEKEWIQGWGYDEGKLAEKRSPNRYDLDRGCKHRPVSIIRSCEHIRCVNSKALEMAGIDENTLDPEGGEIERDERGIPTGVLKESARNLVNPFMPKKDDEEILEDLLNLGRLFNSQGIVAVADMGNFRDGDTKELYEKAMEKGFKQQVSLLYMWDFFKDKEDFHPTGGRVHFGGLKLIGDGSISGTTAWVYEPYLGTDNTGIKVYSDEDMEKAIKKAKELGCPISVHAMGTRAIDRALNRFKDEDVPLRLEHVTEPTKEAIDLAKKMGVSIATQPIFMYSEIETYVKNFGYDRIKRAYPLKTLVDEGLKVCISTDAPATSWADPSNPFVNIAAAVTRTAYDGTDLGKDQAIDVKTAVRLYTIEGAKVMGLEGIGMIKEGYLADFVVLDRDIFNIPKEEIKDTKVLETYIEGEKVCINYGMN
ncbi:MAG: amidohydrolase [Clostridia bacterium]|nr:amidohydrolase [Clostridia bacterium]